MTSKGFGEMFEGDSADICAGKFPLASMGGLASFCKGVRIHKLILRFFFKH